MSLKDYMLKENKNEVYDFYCKIALNPKEYSKVTRNDIYRNIISLYRKDPEIILRLCSIEELHILKKLLDENIKKREYGYIDHLLFQNLRKNYLILENNKEYYIPSDLVNYVKMAMNLLDENTYAMQDIFDSVLIGMSRVYNILQISEVLKILQSHGIYYNLANLKKYVHKQPKLKKYIKIIRYKKEEYLISLEDLYYEDVLKMRKNYKIAQYTLEELISFGKYKLNLFQEKTLQFLNFLEMHLNSENIDLVLRDLMFYCGFDIHDEEILKNICGHIDELYHEVTLIVPDFPVWIYYGNSLNALKENIILPDRNEPCICGSGKKFKFKNCCEKLFK